MNSIMTTASATGENQFVLNTPDKEQAASHDGKLQLLREAKRVALALIANNNIDAGAKVLADYRQRFGRHPNGFLRHGVVWWFLAALMRHCFSWQVQRVSKLLHDHMSLIEPAQNRRALRTHERAMHRKFEIPYRKPST